MQAIQTFLKIIFRNGGNKLKTNIFLIFILTFLSSLLSIYIPMQLKIIIDALSNQNTILDTGVIIVVTYLVYYFLSKVLNQVAFFIYARFEQVGQYILEGYCFRYILNLPFHDYLTNKRGSFVSIITSGIDGFLSLSRTLLFNIAPLIFQFIFVSVVISMYFSKDVLYIIIVQFICFVFVICIGSELSRKYRMKFRDISIANDGLQTDYINNFETIKYFSAEDGVVSRYKAEHHKFMNAVLKAMDVTNIFSFLAELVTVIGLGAVLIISFYAVKEHKITIGDFVLINSYVLMFLQPLQAIGFMYRNIKEDLTKAEKLVHLLNKNLSKDNAPGKILDSEHLDISFNKVNFSYIDEGKIRGGLKDFSLELKHGQKIGIVGKTGAGKSTIFKLLYKFYTPDNGTIKINGIGLSEIDTNWLRQHIAIVPQDVSLFHDTILSNLKIAKENATIEEVITAAKHARLHDFIETLPHKYETLVGERGFMLSGGEKQRMAIARAILKSPKIFVLDEPSSALDAITERQIIDNLIATAEGKTLIVIAHRLSTVQDLDQIYVLDHGRIVEHGPHSELLANKNAYYQLWLQQSKGE